MSRDPTPYELPSPPTAAAVARRAPPLLFAAVVSMAMGQTLVFALLPLLGRAVGLRELQVGIIITASSAVYALATRYWGRRSDHLGRRRVMLVGLAGYTAGTLVFTSLFWLGFEGMLRGALLWAALITARCLQSSVMAGTMPGASAYASDISHAGNRTVAIARLGAANSMGTIIGPALGGLLAGISLLAPLYFAAAVTAVAGLLVFCLLPESPHGRGQGGAAAGPRLHYRDPRYRHLLLIAALLMTAFSVVQQTLGFYFQDALALDSQQAARKVGFALMLAAALALLAQGLLVQRLHWPPGRLIVAGLAALALGSLLLAVGLSATWLYAGVGLCGLGVGLSFPGCVAAASLSVGKDEQGALAGLTTSLPALGSIVGPVLGTGLYQLSPHWPYAGNLVLLLPLLVYAWRRARHHR